MRTGGSPGQTTSESESGSETFVLTVDGERTLAELPVSGEVTAVHLDPRHRILRWTEAYGPR